MLRDGEIRCMLRNEICSIGEIDMAITQRISVQVVLMIRFSWIEALQRARFHTNATTYTPLDFV